MKTIPVKCQRIDEAGVCIEEREVTFRLYPAREGACPECAHYPAHQPNEPHNQQSLHYQYSFRADHGRWPTWKDAVAHCTLEVRELWEAELRKRGAWTE